MYYLLSLCAQLPLALSTVALLYLHQTSFSSPSPAFSCLFHRYFELTQLHTYLSRCINAVSVVPSFILQFLARSLFAVSSLSIILNLWPVYCLSVRVSSLESETMAVGKEKI
jgi:hypothetical protein